MPKGVFPRLLTVEQDLKIAKWYLDGRRICEIARKIDVHTRVVRRALRRTKTPLRGDADKGNPGSLNPAWRGGRHLDFDGYVLVRMPDHPQANNGYVREHRLVMETLIGRYLLPKEVVHHKDGDKENNAPDNLLLFRCNGEHLGVELRGRCPEWSEDGRRRIADRHKPAMKGTHQCPRGSGVRLSRRKLIDQYLHETSERGDTGLVASLEQLLPSPDRHPKLEHEKTLR